MNNAFWTADLAQTDPEIADVLTRELHRQQDHIELIASENIVSHAVLQAIGSALTNKYAEGYPAHRYYHGCEFVDIAETLAIERAKKLFGAAFANVQPHSGSQANAAVYLALLHPGDTIMGMSLDAGGHLTHGSRVSSSGKYYHSVSYGIDENGLIDYDEVARLATEHQPRLIIAGGSAYPQVVDFQKFRAIADRVGAYLMVDMAHFAGLVAGGVYPNPVPVADVVTTTTHKTLRGPRGGMILTNNPDLAKKINSAVFPGLQGGPLMHIIAGKAVAFGEALRPEFKDYARQVIANAKALADMLIHRDIDLVSGGTASHLLLIDLRRKGLTGVAVCDALAQAHLICNKNSVPHDTQKPSVTSGLRVGTPAGTTRGFKEAEFLTIGSLIADVIDAMTLPEADRERVIAKTRTTVDTLCRAFPIYAEERA